MAYRTSENNAENEKRSEQDEVAIMDSDFINLDDLVYAPLHALAKSNHCLRSEIIESIKALSTSKQNGQEETLHLDNVNIAYDQIHSDGDDGYRMDNMQVQVPLLSIVPTTNLGIEEAEIDFSAEVKTQENKETRERKYQARICSPEQRDSDFLPKVSYKLKVKSIPATEGIMRLTDSLSANQVEKKLDSHPIALNGIVSSEEQKNFNDEVSKLKGKINKLKQLYSKIEDMMIEEERLHQISKDAFEEDTYDFDKDKYLMAKSNIVNRIMECQELIMQKEISFGLNDENE